METLGKKVLGRRWKMVGNAVSVPVFEWVGERLSSPGKWDRESVVELLPGDRWPEAAWGWDGKAYAVEISSWVREHEPQHLADFLEFEPQPLSLRAAQGFLNRASVAKLNFPDGLLDAVAAHIAKVSAE